jgi:hypothetical protein
MALNRLEWQTPMTIINIPTNQNYLGKHGFRFGVRKLPNTNFFVEACNIPGISIEPVLIGTPLVNLPFSGDHISYDELSLTFKIDEDLGAYNDIYTWIRQLGFSEDSSEYAEIASQSKISGLGIVSDASLIILDAKKRPNYELVFTNAFPISLTALQLGYTVMDVEYLTTTAQFRYDTFSITRVKYEVD